MAYNSTIISKKKKCSSCGDVTYLFSRGRCAQCAKVEDTKKRIAEFEGEEETESRSNLISDIDSVFSRYIRTKYADSEGYVRCFTSDVRLPIGEMQNGHFIGRSAMALRWSENNCRPQSKHDNEFLHGNLEVFAANLEKERKGSVEELKQLSREVVSPSISELKELLATYRHKLKIAQLKLKKQ